MPDMQDSTDQGRKFRNNFTVEQRLIRRCSVMKPNQYVRDAPNRGESASRLVLSKRLASRFTLRTATQVGVLSDLGVLAQA